MLAKVLSSAVYGLDPYQVDVEVDISTGLPQFNIVGLPLRGRNGAAALVLDRPPRMALCAQSEAGPRRLVLRLLLAGLGVAGDAVAAALNVSMHDLVIVVASG